MNIKDIYAGTAGMKISEIDFLYKAKEKLNQNFPSINKEIKDYIGNTNSTMELLATTGNLAKVAVQGTMAGLSAADTRKGQEAKFQALAGDKAAGSDLYKYAAQYAKGSALSKDQVVGAISASMPFTRDIKQIEQMVKFAERLNALDPTKGFDNAMGAVTAMMQGDASLAKSGYGVNLDERQLADHRSAGDKDGMLSLMDEGLNDAGATTELVGERFSLLGAQISEFKDSFMSAIGETAVPVMETLAQAVAKFNEKLQSGKYQFVINVIVNGMNMIGHGLLIVMNNAKWLIPVVAALTAGLAALNIALMFTSLFSGGVATAFMIAGGVAAIAGISAFMMGAVGNKPKSTPDADTLRDSLDDKLGTAGMDKKYNTPVLDDKIGTAGIDVNIANSDPIKVTGEVDIEKENLKYMLDIAGARFFAMYSTATLAPQLTVQNMQVHETADLGLVFDELTHMLGESVAVSAQGVYEG